MKYDVMKSSVTEREWLVTAIADPPEGDSDVYVVVFMGPGAEARARQYAGWVNGLKGHLCRDGVDTGLRAFTEV